VRTTLHEPSPAGWSIPIDTTGMAAGEHSVTASSGPPRRARAITSGTQAERANDTAMGGRALLTGADEDLGENARKAAARIREHQQGQGYWLRPTPPRRAFTSAAGDEYFSHRAPVDSARPSVYRRRFEDTLRRARAHLTAQIEAGGLVRYHGGLTVPASGLWVCHYARYDDTALVWRLAPAPDRARLATALATIDRYRTPGGSIAHGSRRVSLPVPRSGRDPNPTDIAIQMHLLLLLSEVRPAAGRALCDCSSARRQRRSGLGLLSKGAADSDPSSARRPPRGVQARVAGARLHTGVPDQQIWTFIARPARFPFDAWRLSSRRVLIRAVLRELARDDFALIQTNPPLFYHNDITATVPRYYWSEDLGYALWLRLYDRYEHRGEPHLGR